MVPEAQGTGTGGSGTLKHCGQGAGAVQPHSSDQAASHAGEERIEAGGAEGFGQRWKIGRKQ